jgi:hypothetical protein
MGILLVGWASHPSLESVVQALGRQEFVFGRSRIPFAKQRDEFLSFAKTECYYE